MTAAWRCCRAIRLPRQRAPCRPARGRRHPRPADLSQHLSGLHHRLRLVSGASPARPDRTRLIHGALFPKDRLERDDFADKAANYYKRWDITIEEDIVASDRQQLGMAGSPSRGRGAFPIANRWSTRSTTGCSTRCWRSMYRQPVHVHFETRANKPPVFRYDRAGDRRGPSAQRPRRLLSRSASARICAISAWLADARPAWSTSNDILRDPRFPARPTSPRPRRGCAGSTSSAPASSRCCRSTGCRTAWC